jgi:sugar lactone lactonase YvrE
MLGESPRWHDGRLWLADWAAHEVIAVDTAGRSEVILRVPRTMIMPGMLPCVNGYRRSSLKSASRVTSVYRCLWQCV